MDLTKGKIQLKETDEKEIKTPIIPPPDFIVPTPEHIPENPMRRSIYRDTINEGEVRKSNLFQQLSRDSAKLRYYMYKK